MDPRRPVILFLAVSLAALAGVASPPAAAATIVGTVRAQGPATPAGPEIEGGAYDSRRYKFMEKVDYTELTGFVVWIDREVPEAELPQPRPLARIAQRDGVFMPHILPVVVGTSVEWPNQDTIYHNVFSVSETTPFDLGLYKNNETPRRVTFDRVGRVDVFCSIHTRMSCIVLVLPNPWFASVDARGRYTIHDVPPGTHRLKAWHERLPTKTVEVDVPAEGTITVDFLLGFAASANSR